MIIELWLITDGIKADGWVVVWLDWRGARYLSYKTIGYY